MIKITEIAFIGYPAKDITRARSFYEQILGLTPARVFGDVEACWVEYDIGGTTLALSTMAKEWVPSDAGPSVAFEVEDLGAAVKMLEEKKVTFVIKPFDTEVCTMAVILDSEGNSVTIHKRKPGNH